MGHQNGGVPSPAVLEQASSVPILGQPFVLKAWFLTIQAVCNCGQHEPILIVGQLGTIGTCPACKKQFVIQGLAGDAASGRMNIQLGVVIR